MSETRRTVAVLAAALILALAAWATTPRRVVPTSLQDRGTPFFPGFTDPGAATSLEVIEFDEPTSTPRPFKVTNRLGKWTIPSKNDYPADERNRLPRIAAAIVALKKDDVAGDNIADHERCGVLDPVDDTLAVSKGRGTRLIVRGENNKILADIIVGKPVEGRSYLRYVRLPSQNRTYVARVDALEFSTKFEDWIERNLLQVSRDEIDGVGIRNYSMDQKTGDQTIRGGVLLQKTGDGGWIVAGMRPDEEMNAFNANLLVTTLQQLSITDVVPKPPGISEALNRAGAGDKVRQSELADLARKGFYLTRDRQLLSNEGEVAVHTKSGLFYTLRFGQVASGPATPDVDSAKPRAAGPSNKPAGEDAAALSSENRYMFISVGYDPGPGGPAATRPDTERLLAQQRARFAPWYYVISGESFQKIRLGREALVKAKARRGPGA